MIEPSIKVYSVVAWQDKSGVLLQRIDGKVSRFRIDMLIRQAHQVVSCDTGSSDCVLSCSSLRIEGRCNDSCRICVESICNHCYAIPEDVEEMNSLALDAGGARMIQFELEIRPQIHNQSR